MLQVDGWEARPSGLSLKRPTGTVGDEDDRPAEQTSCEDVHGGVDLGTKKNTDGEGTKRRWKSSKRSTGSPGGLERAQR
jgi:hypothetical protein